MNLPGILGLFFATGFGIVLGAFILIGRRGGSRRFREIPAFSRLRRAVGLAVESGTRLHVSLGWARLAGSDSASALTGLSVLGRITRAASISDRPPVATAGSGDLTILSRDTMHGVYRSLGEDSRYDPTAGRLAGVTPLSYAAGTIPVIHDEHVSANILLGHMAGEAALITDAAEKNNSLTIAGTDSMPGQAVLFAAAQEPLIGEEVFAAGAYLGVGTAHDASLRTQDIARWLVIVLMITGAVLTFLGLDDLIRNLFLTVLP